MRVSNSIKKAGVLAGSLLCLTALRLFGAEGRPQTFCNPLDLPYRFQLDRSCREAADPVIVLFKGSYWLFASKSGGYWKSDDLLHWSFIEPKGLPLEPYAPAVTVVNGKLYYTVSFSSEGTFTTDDPASGIWTNVAKSPTSAPDAATFQDTDGRLYLYSGCDAMGVIKVCELDPVTFQRLTPETTCTSPDLEHRGWEIAGNNNRGRTEGDVANINSTRPYLEGSWMNKIKGKYYLQYAGPGTEFKTYGDGVFVGEKPTGPFTYALYSPFSFKPTGFICGAGHSCTFEDKDANLWHIGSMVISQRHMFERRLGLFPTAVLPDGQLTTDTYLGDYPQYAPSAQKKNGQSPRWMLVSYGKPLQVSSTLSLAGKNFEVTNAVDEDVQTWWSAKTGNSGEWMQIDLEKKCRIDSLQVNFADQGSTNMGRLKNDGYGYFIEVSSDAKKWQKIVDRSQEMRDAPHDYVQLEKPVKARYVRITNVHSPAGGLFSLYDLRVFGSGLGKLPPQVKQFTATRDSDRRCVHLTWPTTKNTQFYIVRYGIAPDRLFGNYQVYGKGSLDINSLNTETGYYFTVDTVNDTGVTQGKTVLSVR